MSKVKWSLIQAVVALVLITAALIAHDPRTTSKDFSAGMIIGGAGKIEITYKGMHWNGPSYDRAMTNETVRVNLNKNVWSALGKAHLDFDLVIGNQEVRKGDYVFGILLEPNKKFTLSLANAANTITVPLETTFDNPDHPYLSIDVTPVDAAKPEQYTLEARCGQFRGTQTITVPYLMPHEHPEEMKKPAEKSK
jgi:hypothetical protein